MKLFAKFFLFVVFSQFLFVNTALCMDYKYNKSIIEINKIKNVKEAKEYIELIIKNIDSKHQGLKSSLEEIKNKDNQNETKYLINDINIIIKKIENTDDLKATVGQLKTLKKRLEFLENEVDEKWRWRTNFKIKIGTLKNNKPAIFDFSKLYEVNNQVINTIEIMNNNSFNENNQLIKSENDPRNILLPFITIIYKKSDGNMAYKNEYIENIDGFRNNKFELKLEKKSIVFLSGTKKVNINRSLYDKNTTEFIIFSGNTLGLASDDLGKNSTMSGFLENKFYNIKNDQLVKQIDFYKGKAMTLKDDSQKFGLYFYHTEDWFFHYLMTGELKGSYPTFARLCKILAHVLEDIKTEIKEVHAVIFHLPSKNEICDVCSPNLSLFMEHIKENKDSIIKNINMLLEMDKKDKKDIFSKLKFFMFTSAQSSDSKQSSERQHYSGQNSSYYGNRRKNFGWDDLTLTDDPIDLTHDLPYNYAQVPVNKSGEIDKNSLKMITRKNRSSLRGGKNEIN